MNGNHSMYDYSNTMSLVAKLYFSCHSYAEFRMKRDLKFPELSWNDRAACAIFRFADAHMWLYCVFHFIHGFLLLIVPALVAGVFDVCEPSRATLCGTVLWLASMAAYNRLFGRSVEAFLDESLAPL